MDNFTRPHRPPRNHPSVSKTSFLASIDDVVRARDELETWLHGHAPHLSAIGVYEVLLAANELFTNAFEHGQPGSGCLYDLRRVKNKLVLTVTNNATDPQLLPTEWWTMPDAHDRTGRGLAIVKTVASDVDVYLTPTSVSIAATFDLGGRTPAEPAFAARLAL